MFIVTNINENFLLLAILGLNFVYYIALICSMDKGWIMERAGILDDSL